VLLFVNEQRNFDNLAHELQQAFPTLVKVHVFDEESDPENTLHQTYLADRPTAYLIRPDGYIAYRTQYMNLNEIKRHILHILGHN